jgi:hypothetical protein
MQRKVSRRRITVFLKVVHLTLWTSELVSETKSLKSYFNESLFLFLNDECGLNAKQGAHMAMYVCVYVQVVGDNRTKKVYLRVKNLVFRMQSKIYFLKSLIMDKTSFLFSESRICKGWWLKSWEKILYKIRKLLLIFWALKETLFFVVKFVPKSKKSVILYQLYSSGSLVSSSITKFTIMSLHYTEKSKSLSGLKGRRIRHSFSMKKNTQTRLHFEL